MRHRLSIIIVMTILISMGGGVFQPLQAAPVIGGKLLERRLARLQKYAHAAAVSSVSSSSSSLDSLAWEAFRMSKRRNGGGHQPVAVASSVSSSVHVLTTPSITFTAITKNYGDSAFVLSPTSNSNGTFTFLSSNPSVATVAGNTVTIIGAGTATITATQAAAGDFTGASALSTLTVNTIAPTIIALISISKNVSDLPFFLSDPVSNSAGAFTFTSTNPSVATVFGRAVTIVGAGTTTIISTQAANGNYKSGSGTTTLTVSPGLEES